MFWHAVYSCNGKANFLAAITPVMSVIWSFRNHSNIFTFLCIYQTLLSKVTYMAFELQFLHFYQLLLSLGIEPMILALLAPFSTIWATGKPNMLIWCYRHIYYHHSWKQLIFYLKLSYQILLFVFLKYKSFVTLYMFVIFEQSLVSHCSHITLFYFIYLFNIFFTSKTHAYPLMKY